MKFSAFVCVCGGDTAEGFKRSFESISSQTVKPDQIVICIDGPITEELDAYISSLADITLVRVESGHDHGISRDAAFCACENELVAVMDSGDTAMHDRFEKQLEYFKDHPKTDVLGGYISEILSDGAVRIKTVPLDDEGIKKFAARRCPFNHMTVMMRRDAAEKAGGYLSFYCNEDYYLWVRLMKNGAVFANLPTVLCNVSVDEGFYARRGGIKYFRSECRLFSYMHKNGLISFPRLLINVVIRLGGEVLLGERGRRFVYTKFLRK